MVKNSISVGLMRMCGAALLPHFSLPVVQALLHHIILLSLPVDAADLLSGRRART